MKDIVNKMIMHMTNKSMELGHYPDPSKHGLIKPLFNRGKKEKDDPESVRPVNILPGPGHVHIRTANKLRRTNRNTTEISTRFQAGTWNNNGINRDADTHTYRDPKMKYSECVLLRCESSI